MDIPCMAIFLELCCWATALRAAPGWLLAQRSLAMAEDAAVGVPGQAVLLGPIQSACCDAWVESRSDLPHPRMVITTHEKTPPMTNEAIAEFVCFLEQVCIATCWLPRWQGEGM